MVDKKFLDGLSNLGFPMFEPSDEMDVNETLAEVVKSRDTRLWEGFPVMVANASDSYQFSPDLVDRLLTDKEQKARFHRLLLLSLSLYSVYHLTYSWTGRYKKNLSKKGKELVKVWKSSLTHNQLLKWDNVELDPERLKGLLAVCHNMAVFQQVF